MDIFNLKVTLAISLAGVTMGMPFVFLQSIRAAPGIWALGVLCTISASAFFSLIVFTGEECGFTETLLMQTTGCKNIPFANSRTVPVLNSLAMVSLLLLIIALLRSVAAMVIGKVANE